MNFMYGIFEKVSNLYRSIVSTNGSIGVKRKRNTVEADENISPKKIKLFNVYTQTDSFSSRGPYKRIFSSRSEKIKNMTKQIESSYFMPSSRLSLRAPQSWNLINMDNNITELSSDEDDSNEIQVVGEEPARNRNPLSSIHVENVSLPSTPEDDGVQILGVLKKGKPLQENGMQTRSFQRSTPSVTPTHRKNYHSSTTSKKNGTQNSMLERSRTHTLNVAMQMDSREQYGALLKRYWSRSSLSSCASSPLPSMPDLSKKLQGNSYYLRPKLREARQQIKVIDLTEDKDKRRAVHIPVKPATSKTNDNDSDIEEIMTIKPVPRVNSYEHKIKSSQFTQPDWLIALAEKYKQVNDDTARKAREEELKRDLFAAHNRKQLDSIEERVHRHMVITDSVLLDEPVEEEAKLPPLTEEIEAKVKAALVPRPQHEVVAEGFSLRITRKDMYTLANLNWLNDEVINFYMNLLIERGKKDKMPKVYAFNTFFYPKLIEKGHTFLKRWTRKIDVFAHDLIVVPVHLGVHWCMAIIDFREKMVEYYDSMGHPNNKCLSALLKYLKEESLDKKNTPYDTSSWKTVNMTDIPQQMNGSDCGMFACTFAEYKCRNAKITFSQADMPYFRRKMVYEILTSRLMIGND